MFMRRVFTRPDRLKESLKRYVVEISKLGVDSIPLVIVISLFIGAVIAIQMQINFSNPLLPSYTVGLATRDVLLLEFSSSILCLILAGKVGSNIASEIGTMRVTEQIDALEIMGVNSCNFIVLPKILALLTFIPVLAVFSMASGLVGGFMIAQFTDMHLDPSKPRRLAEAEKTFARLDRILATERPDLVVFTGDVVTGAPAEGMWRRLLDTMTARRVPFCVVLGNHDSEQDLSRQQIGRIVTSYPGLNTLDAAGELADRELEILGSGSRGCSTASIHTPSRSWRGSTATTGSGRSRSRGCATVVRPAGRPTAAVRCLRWRFSTSCCRSTSRRGAIPRTRISDGPPRPSVRAR